MRRKCGTQSTRTRTEQQPTTEGKKSLLDELFPQRKEEVNITGWDNLSLDTIYLQIRANSLWGWAEGGDVPRLTDRLHSDWQKGILKNFKNSLLPRFSTYHLKGCSWHLLAQENMLWILTNSFIQTQAYGHGFLCNESFLLPMVSFEWCLHPWLTCRGFV